jgi:hypothetical protein
MLSLFISVSLFGSLSLFVSVYLSLSLSVCLSPKQNKTEKIKFAKNVKSIKTVVVSQKDLVSLSCKKYKENISYRRVETFLLRKKTIFLKFV